MRFLKNMNKKKVLYIHQSGGGGGASNSLGLLITSLNRDKYEPIGLFGRGGSVVKALKQQNVKVYIKKLSIFGVHSYSPKIPTLSIFYLFIRFLPNIITVYTIIKKEKIDFVHINSSVLLITGIACRLAGVKVIWHIREIIPNTKIGRLQKWLIKFIASDIIAISKEVAKQINSRKTTLIYNGINPEEFKPDSEREIIRKKYGLNEEKETIFTHLGQLYPAKGSFVFLKAAKLLTEFGYNVKFLMIGGHSISNLNSSFMTKIKKALKCLLGLRIKTWKEELRNFAWDEGIAERVIFTGYRDDIPNFISLSDAVVVPHLLPEPFGRTLIEAGALKKVVISTDIPPTPEIVINGKTGLLVVPNSPEILVKAMEYIINNPGEARQMGENGYQNVMNNFHSETTHYKIRRVYAKY